MEEALCYMAPLQQMKLKGSGGTYTNLEKISSSGSC